MRNRLAIFALSAVGLLMSAAPSNAEITYPWCAEYSRGGRNCGFTTLEQCRAALSGNGGSCQTNTFYRPEILSGPRRRRG
jgi:hypothetical protein